MSVAGKHIPIGQENILPEDGPPEGGIVGPPGVDCDAELLPLLAMTQMFSQVSDARELFRLAAIFTTDSSIGARSHAVAIVSNGGLPAGRYQVTRRFVSVPHRRTIVEVGDADHSSPVFTGGVVGSALRRTKPELITGISVAPRDPLGADFVEFDSMLVLPLFSAGRVMKRAIFFRRGWTEANLEFVSRSLLIMNLVETAIERLAHASELVDANRELDRQFENISRIQRRLIPRFDPERACRWAHHDSIQEKLDIGMSYKTAGRAGGDYFDFFSLPTNSLGVLIADVSGHGADAAMFMAMLRTLIHHGAPWHDGPAAVIHWLHVRLVPLMPDDRFITACALIVHAGTGGFEFSCAGHPAPVVRRSDGQTESLDGQGCFMSPIFEQSDAQSSSGVLCPGDTIVLFTDGLPESVPSTGGPGDTSITRILERLKNCNLDAASTVRVLDDAAAEWRASPEPLDDTTIVALKLR